MGRVSDRAAATTVGVVAVVVLVAVGVHARVTASPQTPSPPAQIADGGPDCLADDVLAGVLGSQVRTGRQAPSAGSVPVGFEPVQVVMCRGPALTLLEPVPPVVVPDLVGPSDGAQVDLSDQLGGRAGADGGQVDADPGLAGADGGGQEAPTPTDVLTVLEVTFEGDLAPLLVALARPSDPVPQDQACPAMAELQPQIYLVDAAGRAVRPQWPVTACGFLHEGAWASLDGLVEVGSTVRTHTTER
ncbi:hypothetical protein [Actinotalea subterranea]|uniref:hypothetical protein n=1 Tax=Actinotalea subterranea TaxID=2607497 RepID=UPI0011F0496F|nr:hypothetical protein [Actinotalea subterranea]